MKKETLKYAALKHSESVLQPYDTLMELCGFDSVYAFIEFFGGSTIYVPQKRTVFLRCIEKEIICEFDGYNYKALCAKYGLSESCLRKIIKNKKTRV